VWRGIFVFVCHSGLARGILLCVKQTVNYIRPEFPASPELTPA
jgi:hypothetical protein